MTWIALFVLAALALAPLGVSLVGSWRVRNRRDAALASHRAQLAELDRDFQEGRIGSAEHASALLEVQRRLLAADSLPVEDGEGGRRWPIYAAMAVVPLLALGLYDVNGHPNMPAAPLASRQAQFAQEDAMVEQLRERLRAGDMDPERLREGYLLLGNSEDALGHLPQAAEAWREAVRLRFDPNLAALAAEAQTRVDGGKVSMDSAQLFRRALAEAPEGAPWRSLAEQRIKEAEK
jgi:cytochrome c-type biogenesis protein CcmH